VFNATLQQSLMLQNATYRYAFHRKRLGRMKTPFAVPLASRPFVQQTQFALQ
jgi:hypothetical protein